MARSVVLNRQRVIDALPEVVGRTARQIDMRAWTVLALVAVLVLPPVVAMVHTSLTGPHGFRAASYTSVFSSPRFLLQLKDTAIFAAGSTAWALVVSVPIAWIVERTNSHLGTLVYGSAFVSFAIPSIMKALAWIFLAAPNAGVIPSTLRSLGLDVGMTVFSMPWMIFVEGLFTAPVAIQLIGISFQMADTSLEEAAAASGARFFAALRRISLPLALPSILAVGVLDVVWGMQTVEVPLLLGVPARVELFSTAIWNSALIAIPPDYGRASAFGTLIFGGVLAAVFLYRWLLREAAKFATIGGRGYRTRLVDIGHWQWLANALCLAFVMVELLPPLYLLVVSFSPRYGSYGLGQQFGLTNYIALLRDSTLAQAALDSLLISGSTALLVVALGFLVAWVVIRGRFRMAGLLEQLANMPLAMTGIVLGVAVLQVSLMSPISVYGTVWIIVLAYVASFLPYAFRYAATALLKIGRELDEAALTSGASHLQVAVRVLLPLSLPAVVGVAIFVFLLSLRELSVSALLYTPNSQILSTFLLDLWRNGNTGEVSSLASLVAAVGVGGAVAAYRLLPKAVVNSGR